MVKFFFIYPPSADPTTPPLALARIKGAVSSHLGSKGRFEFIDENQKFTRYVVDLGLSGKIREWIRNALETSLPNEFRLELERALTWSEHLAEDLLKAMGTLKTEHLFLDISRYRFAYETIEKAFHAFSLAYYPAMVGYATARLALDIRSSAQAREALSSARLNPYLHYFEARVPDYEKADVLGISVVYSSQLLSSLTLAKLVKQRNKGALVIMGGPCASSLRSELEDGFDEFVDLVIPGDAEAFFQYLCDGGIELDEKAEFLDAAQTYAQGPPQQWFKEPDSRLDYSWAAIESYLLPEPIICLDITRGCYYGKCVFCAYGHREGYYRRMRADQVVSVIKDIEEKIGCSKFFFSVDVVDPAFLEEVSAGLISAGLKIAYCLDARLEKRFAQRDFVEMLFRSGCRAISFGMESASQGTLDAMGKGTDSSYFPVILKNLFDAGIHVQVHLIHGFPEEPASALKKTIHFLHSFKEEITNAGASRFALLKGSIIEKNPKKYGISKMVKVGDLSLDYEYYCDIDTEYPSFETFKKTLFNTFPAVGRLTGSTTDYLIYAARYKSSELKKRIRRILP